MRLSFFHRHTIVLCAWESYQTAAAIVKWLRCGFFSLCCLLKSTVCCKQQIGVRHFIPNRKNDTLVGYCVCRSITSLNALHECYEKLPDFVYEWDPILDNSFCDCIIVFSVWFLWFSHTFHLVWQLKSSSTHDKRTQTTKWLGSFQRAHWRKSSFPFAIFQCLHCLRKIPARFDLISWCFNFIWNSDRFPVGKNFQTFGSEYFNYWPIIQSICGDHSRIRYFSIVYVINYWGGVTY